MITQYTPKRPIKVVLWTNVSRIEGTTFSLLSSAHSKDNRLSDLMNFEGQMFIPISNAKIYSTTGEQLITKSDFINVNKQHIIMLAERKD